MNNFDLQAELNRNESDKKIASAELEASRNKWVDYVVKNKNEICAYSQPIAVKKKTRAKLKEFFDKIKIIFGLTPKKGNIDGIETYLQYSDNAE